MVRLLWCVLVFVACSGPTRRDPPVAGTDPNRLLAYVPSDTPYVIASLDPPPPVLRRFMQAGFEQSIATVITSTSHLAGANVKRGDDAWMRVKAVLVDGLRGKPAKEWWAALGIDVAAPFVLYGLGPWPVIRFAVPDAAHIRALLGSALAQVPARSGTAGGKAYWSIEVDFLELVVAVVDRSGAEPAQVVLAMVPSSSVERVLTPAPKSVLQTGALADVAARHKLSRVMSGYIDVRAAIAAMSSATLEEPVRSAVAPVMGACGADLDRVATAFPRLVFGYRSIDDAHFDATMVLEAPPKLIADLGKMRTRIPGLLAVHTTGAMFSGGAAIDLDAFAVWANALSSDLAARPFSCPLLTWINDASRFLSETLPTLHVLHGFKGFAMSVDAVDAASKSLTADVLLVGDTMSRLIKMAQQLIPALNNLTFNSNGNPVEIPADVFGIPWVTSIHVAAYIDQIAIAVGPGSHQRVRARLAGKQPPRSPFASITGNGKRLQKALELMGQPRRDDRFDSLGDFAFHLDITDAGIGIDMSGTW